MTDPKTALEQMGWRVNTNARLTQAVKDFQRGWNLGAPLTVDGSAGPKTLAAMAASLARRAKGMPDFSQNFSASEFRCACGGADRTCRRIWVTRELVKACEAYRKLVGPFPIVRGCRCPTQNRAVGGRPASQHLFGSGVDVPVYEVSVQKLAALRVASGIGYYTYRGAAYVRHLDTRHASPNNTTGSTVRNPATWAYGTTTTKPLRPRPDLAATATATNPPQEEGMKLTDKIRVTKADGKGVEVIDFETWLNRMQFVYAEVLRIRTRDTQAAARDAANAAVLKELQAAKGGLTAAQIEAAAKAGAEAALAETIDSATVQLVAQAK